MVDYPVRIPRALLERPPAARALLRGDDAHPTLLGEVLFYSCQSGCYALARAAGSREDGLFPLCLHAGGSCATGGDVAFCAAGPPAVQLPPLLFTDGRAWAAFRLEWISPADLPGHTVVLHRQDGQRIACGPVTALC